MLMSSSYENSTDFTESMHVEDELELHEQTVLLIDRPFIN
jgi:hypothetical protein